MMLWKPVLAGLVLLASQQADDAQMKSVFGKCSDHTHSRDLNAGKKQRVVQPGGVPKDFPLPPRVVQEFDPGWEDCEAVINEWNRRQDEQRLQSILDSLDRK